MSVALGDIELSVVEFDICYPGFVATLGTDCFGQKATVLNISWNTKGCGKNWSSECPRGGQY